MNAKEILARLAQSGTPPDGPGALRLAVGLNDTLKALETETFPYLKAGGGELHFIYAPYGRGKTHLLLSWQEAARRRGFVTAYIDCQTASSPFTSLPATYRQIAVNLEPPTAPPESSSYGVDSLIELFLTECSSPMENLQRLNQDTHLASDFRNAIIAYGRSSLQTNFRDLQQDLKAILLHHTGSRVRITSLYRMYPWLPRPIGKLNVRNASAWLRSLGSLPFSLGYPGCLIFFDETEKTQHITKLYRRERQQYWANLRNLVDHLALGAFRGCALFFAVVEEFLEEASKDLAALSQRLERMRLPGEQTFPNPRAIWMNIDELTNPAPENPEFFRLMADRLLSVGKEAGLKEDMARRLSMEFKDEAERFARSIRVGSVRDFVKFATAKIAIAL